MSGPLERVLSRQVVACLESNPTWSVEEVQSHLLKTHREYQRKPQTPLRGAISRALQSHRIQHCSAMGGAQGASLPLIVLALAHKGEMPHTLITCLHSMLLIGTAPSHRQVDPCWAESMHAATAGGSKSTPTSIASCTARASASHR